MTAKKPRFDVRDASVKIFLLLGAALIVNVAVSVLVVRPKVAALRQLADGSSPQRQAVATREKEVLLREAYRASLEKARDDMKHLAADVLFMR